MAEQHENSGRGKRTERLLQFFRYEHLPPHLQAISRVFQETAVELIDRAPEGPERTVALRKLLEAKDCAVRAVLEGPVDGN